jgi:hypothetical protein
MAAESDAFLIDLQLTNGFKKVGSFSRFAAQLFVEPHNILKQA